jgi:hypothetical protein
MPFKKTNAGWEYDKKGKYRIPTDPKLFTQEPPPLRNGYGWPMKNKDEVDWERLSKEVEERKL